MDCSIRCLRSSQASCSAYHYDEDSSTCQLGSRVSLSKATSNPGDGSVKVVNANSDDAWHMVIGGTDGPDNLFTVELFNWQTGVGCYIGEYAKHSNMFSFI